MSDHTAEDKRKSLRSAVSSSTLCSADSIYATVIKKKHRKQEDIFYHSVDVTRGQSGMASDRWDDEE